MIASERLLDIEEKYGQMVQRIVPIDLDEMTLRVILYLKDGSNIRVVELWEDDELEHYSYYWLTSNNKLIIGWDNAPHHKHLNEFPHHKHVERQHNIEPSKETCLEDVISVILQQ